MVIKLIIGEISPLRKGVDRERYILGGGGADRTNTIYEGKGATEEGEQGY